MPCETVELYARELKLVCSLKNGQRTDQPYFAFAGVNILQIIVINILLLSLLILDTTQQAGRWRVRFPMRLLDF
jgi:hypothetical protein